MRTINKLICRFGVWLIRKILQEKGTKLKPEYLISKGWVLDKDGCYVEPNVKDRDKVSVKFGNHYYAVWHSEKSIFMACESTVEWLEVYLITNSKHEVRL